MAIPTMTQLGFGAILAAAIAGSFSILGLIISKEQKISDFRREWVEELRADIARFMANATFIFAVMDSSTSDITEAQALTVLRAEIVAMFEASSRIHLKLDSTDPVTAPILATLREFEERVQSATPLSPATLGVLERRLVEQSRVLMRREWHRVRNGETVYRTAKTIAVITTIVSFIGLAAAGLLSLTR
ncbi:hypothetical protein [Teichococcus vastitatis]|uniref:hypothetical protein n=1 Tax=Teichococcus vastitatis TaxID=2307076 RepID=UPI0013005B39|nr:hypothetical protein [Pseudoroseomonas vastitatis]